MVDENAKPEWLESMQVLELKKNDIVIFKTDMKSPKIAIQNLKEIIKSLFPQLNNKVLILEDGMDIGVLRQDQNYE